MSRLMLSTAVVWFTTFATLHAADELEWHDMQQIGVEGRGWTDTESYYDRLPAKAQGVVPDPVWKLSHETAGMRYRFVTDSPTIAVRWTVTKEPLGKVHMSATGASGVDLYARDDQGKWHWVNIGKPRNFPTNEDILAHDMLGSREYMLYLPLYNGVEKVEVGVKPGSKFEAAPKLDHKPIVFYGTSIMQGGCASRPGMSHAAIVGRRLDRPFINLGFSGNGRTEPELADLLAELDASVYVLDPLPNMTAEQVRERIGPAVKKLRAAHPDTPIVLVEDRMYGYSWWNPEARRRNETNQAALKEVYAQLQADGVKNLYNLTSDKQLDANDEDMVDGSHPTDLGFVHLADAIEPILAPLVK